MSREMTPERLAALRTMSEDFFTFVEEANAGSIEAGTYLALLGGALAGFVPDLLDEIERLRRQQTQ